MDVTNLARQGPAQVADERGVGIKSEFLAFLKEFRVDGATTAYYRLSVNEMKEEETTTLFVNFAHVEEHSEQLAEHILSDYFRFEPFLNQAIHEFAVGVFPELALADHDKPRRFYVAFHSLSAVHGIRDLKTGVIGQLVCIQGTVVRSSSVHPELVTGSFRCLDCATKIADIKQQFQFTQPTRCSNPTCENRQRFHLEIDESEFVDFQKVRVQESSDEIPSGSMPRSVDIILRNEAVEKAKAGDKVSFVGSLIVLPDVAQLSGSRGRAAVVAGSQRDGYSEDGLSGLKRLGVRDLTYKMAFLATTVIPQDAQFGTVNVRDEHATPESVVASMTEEERQKVVQMRGDPDLYRKMVDSICPTVFAHDEVKRGVLLMLLGGVHKTTPDGISLRGDINVCIVGDPSTAKSQFLKYVVDFVPRAVYTSGKASSAAGLTAAVVRDEDSNEFFIEAGALMLADNGICCIDEFDKMDQKDQVAIHEAMEQQTISITKAGIQATLNARTSVLAAANPIGGRYDKSKPLKSNIAMTSPIMSRFDLFFVVVDECHEVTDYNIACHITNLHRDQDLAISTPYTTEEMQRYIRFARTMQPKLTPHAQKVLVAEYRKLRQGDSVGLNKSSYRITVRQLESMIRLAEAKARLSCEDKVRPADVREACRLLRKSIIHVETEDLVLQEDEEQDLHDAMDMAEDSEAKKDKGLTVPYESYMKMARFMLHFVKAQEESSGEDYQGTQRSEIIKNYLEQHEAEYDSTEKLQQEEQVLNLVISRLVKVENVLLIVGQDTDESKQSLVVHPNFEVDTL